MIRSRASLDNLIVAPHVQAAQGATCCTCGRLVDEESIVEGYPGETTWAKVLVRHHGAEELRTFDMGSTGWDNGDLASLIRRTNWFVPNEEAGLGLGSRMINPGPAQDDEDRIVSLPTYGGAR